MTNEKLPALVRYLHGRHGVIQSGEDFRWVESRFREAEAMADAQQTEVEQLREIARVVAALPAPDYLDGVTCVFGCGADVHEPHGADCPVTKARALLGEKQP